MFIAKMSKPYPDELLYSWINRLAKENSLSVPSFMNYLMGDEKYITGRLNVDVREEFPILYQSLYMNQLGSMKDLYLELTTFQFESLVMTPGRQESYINNVFYIKNGLNTPKYNLFHKIKICPECVKEDKERYGEPYIHRSHQLSGVMTCHKHGTPLHEYCGKAGLECDFSPDDFKAVTSNISQTSLQAYTDYAQALFEAQANANASILKNIILPELRTRGYSVSDNYMTFINDINQWDYADLIKIKNISYILKEKLISAEYLSHEEILPIIMFLFPDANKFVNRLCNTEPVIQQYTCPICGHDYCSTIKAQQDGWGCPYCSATMSDEELFEHLVKTIGNGLYHPLDRFQSMGEKILMHHDPCGENFTVRPRDFIFSGQGCTCEYMTSFKEAKREIESHEGFKLISFTNANKPVVIYHEKCGQTFECTFRRFKENPVCRACRSLYFSQEKFEKLVEDLTGDEYTVIGKYVNQSTEIKIRHNICGCTQEYTPSAFLKGQRCCKCRCAINRRDLEELLKICSNGRYKITEYKNDHCIVLDTKTGKSINILRLKLIQEIKRPTPSSVLPDLNKDTTEFTLDPAWEYGYNKLLEYKDMHNSVNVTELTTFKGYRLGLWCYRQRQNLLTGKLNADQIDRLNALGFIWDPRNDEWERKFRLYQKYIDQTGSVIVPRKTYFEGEKLGKWVEYQKILHKNGSLSEERKSRLDSVGFPWDTHVVQWERKYELYQRYVKQTGTFDIHEKAVYDGENLGRWVYKQKYAFRNGTLPKERIQKLLKLNPHFFE